MAAHAADQHCSTLSRAAYCSRVGVLVGIVVLAAATVLLLVTANPWLPVSQTMTVPGIAPSKLEDPMLLLLSNIAGSEVARSQEGAFTLHLRRTPAWVVVPLILTFPIGLLFLLVKQSGSLLLTLAPVDEGTQVRMVGRTKKSVVKTLAKAMGSLGART